MRFCGRPTGGGATHTHTSRAGRPADPANDVAAAFSVVELTSQELAGEALLWGINPHNRLAHIGIALRPSFRRRGFSTDVIGLLCSYGFTILRLHRLKTETQADN